MKIGVTGSKLFRNQEKFERGIRLIASSQEGTVPISTIELWIPPCSSEGAVRCAQIMSANNKDVKLLKIDKSPEDGKLTASLFYKFYGKLCKKVDFLAVFDDNYEDSPIEVIQTLKVAEFYVKKGLKLAYIKEEE